MTKDLLSRTIISIGGLFVFIILAVGSVDTDSVDSPSSSSPKTYKPSKPKRPDLNATVVFTGSQFVISNHNNFDWTNVKLEINSGIIRGGYTLRVGRMSAGQTYTVGAAQFSKSDGERFNPFTHKVKNITITCDDFGFYYAEWK